MSLENPQNESTFVSALFLEFQKSLITTLEAISIDDEFTSLVNLTNEIANVIFSAFLDKITIQALTVQSKNQAEQIVKDLGYNDTTEEFKNAKINGDFEVILVYFPSLKMLNNAIHSGNYNQQIKDSASTFLATIVDNITSYLDLTNRLIQKAYSKYDVNYDLERGLGNFIQKPEDSKEPRRKTFFDIIDTTLTKVFWPALYSIMGDKNFVRMSPLRIHGERGKSPHYIIALGKLNRIGKENNSKQK